MKKKFIPFILLALIFSACNGNNNNNTSSESSSSSEAVITGVEVVGEQTIQVGSSTTLIVDVVGSDYDDVIFTSSDQSIATVTQEGVVTAVSEGTVEITATSIENPAFSGSITINCYYPNIKNVKLVVEEIEGLYYDATNDVYNVPLGRPFNISYEVTNPEFYKKPTFVNYKLTLPSGLPNTNIFTLEPVPETDIRTVYTHDTVENAVITLEVGYESTDIPHLYDAVEFNVVDINAGAKKDFLDDVAALKEYEKDNLTDIEIRREKIVTENNETTTTTSSYKGSSYKTGSYSHNTFTTKVGDEVTETSENFYHHSISKDYYISFEADKDNHIVNLFSNKALASNEGLEEQIKYMPLFYEGTMKMGLNEILTNFFETDYTTIDKDISTFGNSTIYAFANFEYGENYMQISSECTDLDTDYKYDVSLKINYIDEVISSYIFEEKVIAGEKVIEFTEVGNTTRGEKKVDNATNNENYIDTNIYYYSSFEVVDFHGKKENPLGGYIYDYSNDDKYGVDAITEEDGLTKYTLTYDKTLVLKIKDAAPSTANSLIDRIKAVSSDETQIASVETIGEDLFAINPLTDKNGLAKPGKATFTFTSRSGTTFEMIVEFITKDLQGLLIRGIEDTNLGSIYEGSYSNYFYINAIPDEDKYTFGIQILTGEADGITLNRWAYDNEFGYPGFSYYISGVKPGDYSFKFIVNEDETVTSEETYSITVIEVLTADEIAEMIVGNKYKYATQNNTHVATMTFDSETQITFENEMNGMDKVSTTLSYTISDGHVKINQSENNTLGAGFYWSSVSAKEILFNEDFTSMQIEFADPSSGEGSTFGKYYVTFNKVIDEEGIGDFEEYINGKTFTGSSRFITGLGMSTPTISFADGIGTLTINSTLNNVESTTTITFNYVYVSTTNLSELQLSNIFSSNSNFTLKDTADVDMTNSSMTFRLSYSVYGTTTYLEFPLI